MCECARSVDLFFLLMRRTLWFAAMQATIAPILFVCAWVLSVSLCTFYNNFSLVKWLYPIFEPCFHCRYFFMLERASVSQCPPCHSSTRTHSAILIENRWLEKACRMPFSFGGACKHSDLCCDYFASQNTAGTFICLSLVLSGISY